MYVLSSVTDDRKSGSNENPPTHKQRECGVTVGYKSGSKGKRASTQQNESQTPDFIEDNTSVTCCMIPLCAQTSPKVRWHDGEASQIT